MLPSPIIEGTIPACYSDANGMVKITVPFVMSRAVNRNEIDSFSLKIKSLQGSSVLLILTSKEINFNDSYVTFTVNLKNLEKNPFSIGAFYKVQLAYEDRSGTVGYYSTVGIMKYTTKPTVSILGLSLSANNTHCYSYTGVYSQADQSQDPTEKIYSYRFVIRNNNNDIIEDTGYLIHNSSNDTEYNQSQDIFSYSRELSLNEKYTITYSVKTNNGIEISSPAYKIIEKAALPLDTITGIYPIADYENGIIKIHFNINPNPINEDEVWDAYVKSQNETAVKGSFVLSRASEDTLYTVWETLIEFSLFAQKPSNLIWKDFTIEQGKKYKYSIQQYSKINQLYSQRLISKPIMADFEDSFLYDGVRQLKIKFNPKVSSFKKNLFEAKVDTLGSKYPFIFRNGQVEYREFPISGLISYFMDDQSFFGNYMDQFITKEREYSSIYTPYIWLTDRNPYVEKSKQKTQYKKDYLFLYIWDDLKKDYVKWTSYLDEQTFDNDAYSKYKDYSNYERYYEPGKNYFLKLNQEEEKINLNDLKLKTTDQIGYNIGLERDFKMEVLKWLTNGEPKLFRSPAEGNFIVRLMNVSLTPEDRVGRMLHSFNSTAYEIADFSYDTLKKYSFIDSQNFKSVYFKVQTIPLVTKEINYKKLSSITYKESTSHPGTYYVEDSLKPIAGNLEFIDIVDVPQNTSFMINGNVVKIGATENLKIELPISEIRLLSNLNEYDLDNLKGSVTIGYYTDVDDSFSYISGVEIKEVIGKQFIGYQQNIINNLKDIITEPISYYLIRTRKRKVNKSTWQEINNGDLPNIDLYSYTADKDPSLGKLYQRIYFDETEFYDTLYHQIYSRESAYRTFTNRSLQNIRDYESYLNSGLLYTYNSELDNFDQVAVGTTLNQSQIYFTPVEITYIHDPLDDRNGHKYLSDVTYYLYEELWSIIESLNPASEYCKTRKGIFNNPNNFELLPFKISAKFNDSQEVKIIDLFETAYYQLKDFNTIKEYGISAGLYADFTYSVQIKNYDISRNPELREQKDLLDMYNEILSKDTAQKYRDLNKLNEYIELLNAIYHGISTDVKYKYGNEEFSITQTYDSVYGTYIEKLSDHIENLQILE